MASNMLFKRFSLAALVSVASALFTDVENGQQPELYLSNLLKHQSPPHRIDFRLPPSFENSDCPSWEPTPANWFLGTWYFSHSNSFIYQEWQNMQWTLSQTETNSIDGTLQDLTSEFALNRTDFVFMNYGIDTPSVINGKLVPDSYVYLPTGPLAFSNNTWAVIAWGYDTVGVPYAVVYETEADGGYVGPSFDIMSRDDAGPSKATLDLIFAGAKDLHNQQLNELIASVKKLTQNGGRYGELYPSCNETCQTNAYAFGIALGTGGS